MRDNRDDRTLERNHIQKWQFLMGEYALVKQKKHPHFRFVQDFYNFHGINRQTFAKYRNRYLQSQDPDALLPQKRGPKWKSRRTLPHIERKVVEQRIKGINRYEIYAILKPELGDETPSPSTIYVISKRHGLNRLAPKMKRNKRKIISERAGQLGHLDVHHLSRDLIVSEKQRCYLVAVIDGCTRLAWADVVKDKTSLSVMFAALKCINVLNAEYGVRFEAMLTDNGKEVASRSNVEGHPFERMLWELGIKHRYIRPYHPQTNGKVERLWRTMNEDLIEYTTFDSLEHFRSELMQYLLYYNTERPHQGIDGNTPLQTMQFLSTN